MTQLVHRTESNKKLTNKRAKQVQMWYGSEIGRRCCVCAGQTLCKHSSDGSTFLLEITSWPPSWKYDVTSKIWHRQSTRPEEQSCQISSPSDL